MVSCGNCAIGLFCSCQMRSCALWRHSPERIRGEIFFAQRWMIVEGQAEYLLLHGLAHGLGYDLDEHGASVIDAQNNGSPDTFAVLARALGIPWCAVFDGDDAGRGYVNKIAARDFDTAFVAARCKTLPAGDLEQQLLADGLEPDLRRVLQTIGQTDRSYHGSANTRKMLKSL